MPSVEHKHYSPLRYPGGKACLASFLAEILELNDLLACPFYEPYAGGAGAALSLLLNDIVSEVHLNDADPRVACFWRACIDETERFLQKLECVPLTIDEWHRQKSIAVSPEKHSTFETGFSTFYLNRCNRSGVLVGSGPIGGYLQKGKWKLDARFYRKSLSERILHIAERKKQITISNEDALTFLKKNLPRGASRRNVFVYLDPPYVEKGRRLYLNAHTEQDHRSIAQYLSSQSSLHWLLSYDDTQLVRSLYSHFAFFKIPISYSLQKIRRTTELAIPSKNLLLPYSCYIKGRQSDLPQPMMNNE